MEWKEVDAGGLLIYDNEVLGMKEIDRLFVIDECRTLCERVKLRANGRRIRTKRQCIPLFEVVGESVDSVTGEIADIKRKAVSELIRNGLRIRSAIVFYRARPGIDVVRRKEIYAHLGIVLICY